MGGEGNEVKENGPTTLTEGRALVSQDYYDDGVRISGNAGMIGGWRRVSLLCCL